MNQKRPIGIDLFSGAGGLSLGFEQAGFDVVAAVEFDPIHCATHEYNFPDCKVICKSVADTNGSEIRRLSGIGNRDIDVVFGGPPCQGFSMIGKRSLDDERNSLVRHFLRLVLELKPKYFLMENVPGLAIGEHSIYLKRLMEKFERGGYKIERNYRILKASNYGVPQNRKRLFLFGCRKEFKLPLYPKPVTQPAGSFDTNGASGLPHGPSVMDAIGDLPDVEKFPELYENDSIRARFKEPSEYASCLRGLKRAEDDRSYPRNFDPAKLTSSMRTVHNKLSKERFAATPHGKTEPVSRFYKLDPKGACNTLRAGTASDRGAYTSPRPIHPSVPRCITVREAARLHSYPDWFRFHKTKWHGFRQVGNSVPPLLGKAVAGEIIKALGAKPACPKKTVDLGNESLLGFDMSEAEEYYSLSKPAISPRRRMNAEVKVAE